MKLTKILLSEKLGVQDRLLLASEELYDVIVDDIINNQTLLNEPSAVGQEYNCISKVVLKYPIKLNDNYQIEKLNINYVFVGSGPSEIAAKAGSMIGIEGMGVNRGYELEKDSKRDTFILPKRTNTEANIELNFSFNERIDLQHIPNPKKELLKLFKNARSYLFTVFAHELKHVSDFSHSEEDAFHTYRYMGITNTMMPRELLDSLYMFFYIQYYGTFQEIEVKATQMAKTIQVLKISKQDFLSFIKQTEEFGTAKYMENYSYSTLMDPIIESINRLRKELYPNGVTGKGGAAITSNWQNLKEPEASLFGSLVSAYDQQFLGSKNTNSNHPINHPFISVLDLINSTDPKDDELLAMMLILGDFKNLIEESIKQLKTYLTHYATNAVANLNISEITALLNFLPRYEESITKRMLKEYDIFNGPEGLKRSIHKIIKNINRQGTLIKRKLARLYAYDEIFTN